MASENQHVTRRPPGRVLQRQPSIDLDSGAKPFEDTCNGEPTCNLGMQI